MESTVSTFSKPLLVFYGQGAEAALTRYGRVVLQPSHYTGAQLRGLKAAGTQPLAYLSLGEDVGPSAPWHRPESNPMWGGHYVFAAHSGWSASVLHAAQGALDRGFGGFFLDTLDVVDLFPEERAPLLELVARLRALKPSYILANRGFALFPELAEHVDGLLFEAFSSTWHPSGGYRALAPNDLLYNVEVLESVGETGLELYALDYADTPELSAFARARAQTHGLVSLISNRDLTRLEGVSSGGEP